MRPTIVAVLVLLAAQASLVAAEGPGFKVVVNTANATTSMKRADLSRLFLRKLTAWPDGKEAQAIDQERVAPARQAFSKAVHQKDADAISSYWQVLVFSGRDVPPRIGRTDAEVLEFVKSNPGGVGYVSEDAPTAGVKTLTVVP